MVDRFIVYCTIITGIFKENNCFFSISTFLNQKFSTCVCVCVCVCVYIYIYIYNK